jgi:predicted glycoside hydrolase/deacetylase ChbG (UPF0249 family)
VAGSNVIFNADDFGASEGINRGIVECHVRGVLTSASLMVTGAAAEQAAQLVLEHERLGVGLHFDVDGERERDFPLEDLEATGEEFERQLGEFERLVGRPPTHVDSHHHVHRAPGVADVIANVLGDRRVPLRDDGRVTYVGGFYAQWEPPKTDLYHVSPEFLIWILENEASDPWVEIACHPGYRSPGFSSEYLDEREVEVATLTDPGVGQAVQRLGLRLASYTDYARESGG